jgi:site-specific recombinase XerD
MKILLWLYKSKINKKGLSPIMMRITLKGQRINFPTHVSTEEKNWDVHKQQIKGGDELTKKYNHYLLNLKAKAWEVYNNSLKEDTPLSAQKIRDCLSGKDTSTYSLIEALDYQINQLKARIGHDIAPATLKKYETCKRKVQEFLLTKIGTEDIFLDQLNHQFIHELDLFMRVKQGLKNNGVAKNMQQLKRVIRVALLNEWIAKDPFAKYECKLEEPKRVHLTKEELHRLEQLALPSERLTKVRDVFVFSCYTGLAYADVSKLSQDHIHTINGTNWIILDRTKTKNQSTIPIFPKAMEILKHYQNSKSRHLLPLISSQNLNKYLKEIAETAGINKRLSFHAARHTFATTVTLNNGVDITSVSAMLGHKMLKTTQIYAKVNLQKISADVQGLMKKGGD